MQILQISLYGKNGERRDVNFNLSSVNIITGASKKGKSSLIDIVEYCIGASECAVAEGCIRETVLWYGVLFQFPDTQVFIARAAPLQGQMTNSTAYLDVAKECTIPSSSELTGTTNISSVVDFLTSKLGVPEQITEVPEDQTRPTVKLGFKHSRYYLFQGQDEIAARRILFHRQAEPHIPQNIKDTIPYFLGAAEDDRLGDLEKLRNLKREKVKLRKRLQEIESVKGEGLQKGYGLLAEAAGVGLYEEEDMIPDEETLLTVLHQIAKWRGSDKVLPPPETSPLYDLEVQYQRLYEEKKIVRSKIVAATEYSTSATGFVNEVNAQHLRLESIGLFKKLESNSAVCPICESEHESSTAAENVVMAAIEDLNEKLEGVARNRPRVTGYLGSLRGEDARLAQDIKRLRESIESLKAQEIEYESKDQVDLQRAHTVGRISLYLDGLDWDEDTGSIEQQIRALTPKIEELEIALDPDTLKEKLDAQLSCISQDMSSWAKELGLEHSEHPIRLDVSKLTVVAETPHGRIPLQRMGSGENWVGYHLVAYLALAKWFIEQNRPVGRFVFFDQPTQVYFPTDKVITGDLSEIEDDEDRRAVKNMFEWIFKIAQELHPHLQIIITDHADIDEDWFQSAIVDEKWRGNAALIPRHWYEEDATEENKKAPNDGNITDT